jgi:hypothetical protein
MNAVSTYAERLLTFFVPKAEAQASECRWETKCSGTCVWPFSQRRERLCCTSNDSKEYCLAWEKAGCC